MGFCDMSFFSNTVRLIRRRKNTQNTQDNFDIFDSSSNDVTNITKTEPSSSEKSTLEDSIKSELAETTPESSSQKIEDKEGLKEKSTSLGCKIKSSWTAILPETPVKSDFRPIFRSDAFSTHINLQRATSTKTLVPSGIVVPKKLPKIPQLNFFKKVTSTYTNKRNLSDTDGVKTTKTNNAITQIKVQNDTSTPIGSSHVYQSQLQSSELGFSLCNYAAEAFSVMIVRPLSGCMHKILRASYFTVTGILIGSLVALITCLIALQFGSVENSVISAYLLDKFENMLPDSDLSIKSAMLQWNSDEGSVEVCLNKVRFGDFLIPKVSILPSYTESLKKWKFVADAVSIIKPKITIQISDDFETLFINPNFQKTKHKKLLLEPFSTLIGMKDYLVNNGTVHKDATIKLINADISIIENGQSWNAQNLHCEYKLGDTFPKFLDFSSVLPAQKYTSSIRIARFQNNSGYDIKFNSLNPGVVYDTFVERNTPLEKFLPLIQGYNLPVSGTAKVFLNPDQTFKTCSFDLLASKGTIRLPNRSNLSLNLGKRIDNGSISGTIEKNRMNFENINISYGNSGVKLTGLSVPIHNEELINRANIDGTLSLINVNLDEVYGMLPQTVSKPVFSIFHSYIPGFRLDLLKFDVKGPISFGENSRNDNLLINQGMFKIHSAQIPVTDKLTATDVDAIGTIKNDGFDIKVSGARLGKVKVNNGMFFISNKDKSWIGKVNANLPVKELQQLVPALRSKSIQIQKLKIDGVAKTDVKLVRLATDNFKSTELPFKITEGATEILSEDNSQRFRCSWNDKDEVSVVADMKNGKQSVHLEATENTSKNSGTSQLQCIGNTTFLTDTFPFLSKDLHGNFDLTLKKIWNNGEERADLTVDLKDATLRMPVVGNVKQIEENGIFKANIKKTSDKIMLSQIVLETPKIKINGHVTTDTNWNLKECVLENIATDGISAKANIFKKNDKELVLSLVGDSFNAKGLAGLFEQAQQDVKIVTYLNMKEIILSNNKLKNIKGTIEILGGKIVDGSCIGTLGDSTLAMSTKKIENGDDHLVSISASDAEKFLKTFGIGASIDGGTISFSIKSSDIAKGIVSGTFEMNNFLVKNNPQLIRLITLSSPNYLNGVDLVVGFNTCVGQICLENQKLKIRRFVAISPNLAISMDGEYDRFSDEMNIMGTILPVSSLTSPSSNGRLAAHFNIMGSCWSPILSVNTPEMMKIEFLQKIFGNLFPILNVSTKNTEANEEIDTLSDAFTTVNIVKGTPDIVFSESKNIPDPYTSKSFDKVAQVESKKSQIIKKLKAKRSQADIKLSKIKNNFGVNIKRGASTKQAFLNRSV